MLSQGHNKSVQRGNEQWLHLAKCISGAIIQIAYLLFVFSVELNTFVPALTFLDGIITKAIPELLFFLSLCVQWIFSQNPLKSIALKWKYRIEFLLAPL